MYIPYALINVKLITLYTLNSSIGQNNTRLLFLPGFHMPRILQLQEEKRTWQSLYAKISLLFSLIPWMVSLGVEGSVPGNKFKNVRHSSINEQSLDTRFTCL